MIYLLGGGTLNRLNSDVAGLDVYETRISGKTGLLIDSSINVVPGESASLKKLVSWKNYCRRVMLRE
jgi:hypothetical protein